MIRGTLENLRREVAATGRIPQTALESHQYLPSAKFWHLFGLYQIQKSCDPFQSDLT